MLLLGLTALVGLLFYVYNIGDVVNRRLELQSSADSAAISGGAWMARSMNLVAMNNVGMSRSIAAVAVLDSLPLAAQMSLHDASSWHAAAQGQLRRGVGGAGADSAIVRAGLESLAARLGAQRDALAPVDQWLNRGSFRMDRQTAWLMPGRGDPAPHGAIWRAAIAMDDLNRATVESAGLVAQSNAATFGKTDAADLAFIAPVVPRLPARRTGFDDFRPTIMGSVFVTSDRATFNRAEGLGGSIPDGRYPHRLGPWARLYRWRLEEWRSTGWQWVPGTPGSNVQGGEGNVSLGGRRVGSTAVTPATGHGGYMTPTNSVMVGYKTYGPYRWMLDQVDAWASDHGGLLPEGPWRQEGSLPDSFFYDYLNDLGRIKLGYMFPARVVAALETYHRPRWLTNYVEAKTAAENGEPVDRTMYFVIEIASKFAPTDPRYLTPGTFRTNVRRPLTVVAEGWHDGADWGLPQVDEHIWQDRYTYETTEDPDIAIVSRRNEAGEPIFQQAHMTAYYVFGGADMGGLEAVDNPGNWKSTADLPAPVLLDAAAADYDPLDPRPDAPARSEFFSFLGVARGPTAAKLWPFRFRPAEPTMHALAQAKLFNSTSWDLWTQDWQVQLMPVGSPELWQQRLADGQADQPLVSRRLPLEDLKSAEEFLGRIQPQATDAYMRH